MQCSRQGTHPVTHRRGYFSPGHVTRPTGSVWRIQASCAECLIDAIQNSTNYLANGLCTMAHGAATWVFAPSPRWEPSGSRTMRFVPHRILARWDKTNWCYQRQVSAACATRNCHE